MIPLLSFPDVGKELTLTDCRLARDSPHVSPPSPPSMVEWMSLFPRYWFSQRGFYRQWSLKVLCEKYSMFEKTVPVSWKLIMNMSPLKVERNCAREACWMFSDIMCPNPIRSWIHFYLMAQDLRNIPQNTPWEVLAYRKLSHLHFFQTIPHNNFVTTE